MKSKSISIGDRRRDRGGDGDTARSLPAGPLAGLVALGLACTPTEGATTTATSPTATASTTGVTTTAAETSAETSTTAGPSTSEATTTTGEGTTTAHGTTTDEGETETTANEAGGCGPPETFEAGRVPTRELHVRGDGSNHPECGALNSPCASLVYAAGLATPGTAVVIHAGTYPGGGQISGLHGTAEAPIWIGGAAGEARPQIIGGGLGFQLSAARYVIVHDLEIADTTVSGINADDGGEVDNPEAARHLVFRDLAIHDVGMGGNQDCLKLSGIDDYWVLSSEFVRCGAGGSAVDHVGCHHGVLYGNTFRDLGATGIQAKGGSENLEIRANHFEAGGARAINMGGSTGFEFFRPPLTGDGVHFEAREIRVIANVFRGSTAPVAFVGCVDCLVANNVFDTPEKWVLRILQETVSTPEYTFAPTQGGRFFNNIVYFDSAVGPAVNIGDNTDPTSFVFAHNLWYRYDDPAASSPPGGLPTVEENPQVGVDPQFHDPQAGDFHLGARSPAIAAGGTFMGIGGDADGRCFADPPSVGAYEFSAP